MKTFEVDKSTTSNVTKASFYAFFWFFGKREDFIRPLGKKKKIRKKHLFYRRNRPKFQIFRFGIFFFFLIFPKSSKFRCFLTKI